MTKASKGDDGSLGNKNLVSDTLKSRLLNCFVTGVIGYFF